MTENKVIQRLKNRLKTEEQRYGKEFVKEYFDDIDFAISALKEIQQYRKNGTVEECQEAVEKLPKAEEVINKLLCGDYNSPCMFCVYGEDDDAECCNIDGGKSWCYKNAQWKGEESEEE